MPEPDITEQRVRSIAKEYAREGGREGAREVLEHLGVDIHNPREAQQDMALLRRMRQARDRGAFYIVYATLTAAASGAAWAVWESLKNQLK